MVEQKNGNKLSRHIAIALLPTAALLLGTNVALATNSIDQKGQSAFAIGGTGVNAIGGTGRAKGRAIGGTGIDAIGGTGINAIGGTGVNAIGGTGVNAIGGTGVNAIGGTGRAKGRAIGGTGIDAIGGTGRGQLMLLGPIDSVDQARGSITVMGRKLQLPSGEAGSQILNSYASGASLQVAVLGSLSTSGKIADLRIQVLPAPYVAGVSEIVLTGIVQALDKATGLAVINGIAVDYNALLQTRANAMRVGNVVTVRGTMPQIGQAINASVLVIHGR